MHWQATTVVFTTCLLYRLVVVSCLIAVVRSAEEEYDYEEEPAAPVTPAPARSNSGRLGGLLSSRGRVNVGRKSSAPVSCDSLGTNHRTEPINVLCFSRSRRNRPPPKRWSSRWKRRKRATRNSTIIKISRKKFPPRPLNPRRKFAAVSDLSGNRNFHCLEFRACYSGTAQNLDCWNIDQ